ncbi:hypothetical protein [Rathayibacter sp. AY1C9]|uniref:hypothetical protein n=1 Tax=Rathayibacter sp. AY1C9 TaxID=2080541 RepID=UPI0011B0CF30|nr:hypothetical protein [Rathayibacter sp. AY1C9]
MLDGLELNGGYGAANGALRESVVKTITALNDEGLIQPRHFAMCQLALELADAVTAGTRAGRASAVAMAAAQLRETLLALPQPREGSEMDKFNAWVQALNAAAASAQPGVLTLPPAS